MAKTITSQMRSHIQQGVTTLCTCWKITRTDGTVMGFTDHDEDIEYVGVTYKASSGYKRTAVKTDEGLAVDGLDVMGVLDDADITIEDLRNGVYNYAAVQVFVLNWADLTMGAIPIRSGRFGETVISQGKSFQVELRGLAQVLNYTFGELYSPGCRADLGDARCGVDVDALLASCTIASVTTRAEFFTSGVSQATGYFNGGLVKWTSGSNSGGSMEVKDWNNGTQKVTLFLNMPFPVQVGDTFDMYPGCNKTRDTCINKFNNIINFRGEPDLPGRDAALGYPGAS